MNHVCPQCGRTMVEVRMNHYMCKHGEGTFDEKGNWRGAREFALTFVVLVSLVLLLTLVIVWWKG